MHPQSITSLLVAAAAGVAAQSDTVPVTGKQGNATVVTNNPQGVVYVATFPEKAFTDIPGGGNVKGSVIAMAAPGGRGVIYKVHFSNLPEGGPFPYHLHVDPVPADGNCTKTLAHLDPFIRGETPVCDPKLPETCQVGDLSGKFGAATGPTYDATYVDLYSSTMPGIGAFFGNRSIVLHYPNKTRITCANFMMAADAGGNAHPTDGCSPTGASNGTYTPLPTGGHSGTPTNKPPVVTVQPGAAHRLTGTAAWSVGAVAMVSALMYML